MSLEVDDRFEKARKEGEAQKAGAEVRLAFGKKMAEELQEKVCEPVACEFFADHLYDDVYTVHYFFYVEPDRSGFLGRFRRRRRILKMADYRSRERGNCDLPEFHIVVQAPELRPAAEHLAGWLTLVHGAKTIKLTVTDREISL